MFFIPKYRGTELRVYDPEEYDIKSPRNIPLLNFESSTFLRAVRLQVGKRLQRQGIDGVLERVDHELSSVADLCETAVIGHKWGLYPLVNRLDHMRYRTFLPANPKEFRMPLNHIVVAEVDIIRNPAHIKPGSKEGFRINQGLHTYHTTPNPHILVDVSKRQFISGSTDVEIASEVVPVMPKIVDVEPRIR